MPIYQMVSPIIPTLSPKNLYTSSIQFSCSYTNNKKDMGCVPFVGWYTSYLVVSVIFYFQQKSGWWSQQISACYPNKIGATSPMTCSHRRKQPADPDGRARPHGLAPRRRVRRRTHRGDAARGGCRAWRQGAAWRAWTWDGNWDRVCLIHIYIYIISNIYIYIHRYIDHITYLLYMVYCIYGQDGGAARGSLFWLRRASVLCILGFRRIAQMADEICFQNTKPQTPNPKPWNLKFKADITPEVSLESKIWSKSW